MSSNRCFAVASAVVAAALCSAVPRGASPGTSLIVPPRQAAALQTDLNAGRFTALPFMLAPCEADRTPAAQLRRPASGVWSGEFSMPSTPAVTGWVLRIQNGDRSEVVETRVGDPSDWIERELSPGRARVREWAVPLMQATEVQIQLLRDPQSQAPCPPVRLKGELERRVPGKPRGAYGRDDRWLTSDARIDQLPNAADVRRWSRAIVHLDTLTSPTLLVPCTGSFISEHVVLTAAHCLESTGNIRRTRLRVGGAEVSGAQLTLLMMQEIDYALVWVDNPPPHETLTIGVPSQAEHEYIIWQIPEPDGLKISVEGCRFGRMSAASIQHQCDTEYGSSGSPVQIRGSGALTGLHYRGCVVDNGTTACVNLARTMAEIGQQVAALKSDLSAVHGPRAQEVLAAFGVR
jgi:hypothetical protein